MATTKIKIGEIPIGRGEWNASAEYYKENTVTLYDMSFRAKKKVGKGVAPAVIGSDGKVVLRNTDVWELMSGNPATYNTANDVEKLSHKVDNIKPIVINGNVTNAPDEEDITFDGNNLLKLKDRSAGNGMGYVILRTDKTFAEQVTQPNTIYEIRYDFDLGGSEVAIPNNCVLKFAGGSIANGTITGDNTDIEANVYHILKNITIQGTYNVLEAYPEWFGAKGDGETDDRFTFIDAFKVSKILHLKSSTTYAINCDRDDIISNARTGIVVPSGGIILGNHATLQALTSTYAGFNVVYVLNSDNVLIENLNIIGDKDTHTNLTTENQVGIHIRSSHHVSVRNCNICKLMGDGIGVGDWESTTYDNPPTDITISNVFITDCTRNGIAIIAGERIYIYDSVINNIDGAPMGPWACVDIEPNSSVQSVKDVLISGCDFDSHGAVAVDANNGVKTLSNITIINTLLKGGNNIRLTTGTNNSVTISHCIARQITVRNNSQGSNVIVADCTIKKKPDAIGINVFKAIDSSSTTIKNVIIDCVGTTTASMGTVPIYLANDVPLYNVIFDDVYITGGNISDIVYKSATLDKTCAFSNVRYNGNITKMKDIMIAYTESIKKDIHCTEVEGFDGIKMSIYDRYIFSALQSSASIYLRTDMADGWHTIINNDDNKNVYIEIPKDVTVMLDGQIITSRVTIAPGKVAKVHYDTIAGIAICYTDNVLAKNGETSQRPTLTTSDSGCQYYDTTLNKPIWWTGTSWVDATGATV